MKPLCPAGTRQTRCHSAGVSRRSVIVCAALLCLLANCSSASITPARSARAASERVVLPADFGGTVTIRQGDVLVVRPPMTAAEWQVSYDGSFLEFKGSPDSIAHPDANGWTFHAIRAGETSLTVSPVMRGGPNPPRFSVTIHIDA